MIRLRLIDDEEIMVMKIETESSAPSNYYTGATEITPNMNEQILPTRNKTMADDVTVHAIPVDQTINASDGYTVTIEGI